MNNIDTTLAAIAGFEAEHGVKPSFILLTTDIFRAISADVNAAPNKYKGIVDVWGENIKIADIKVAQLPGSRTMELVVDPAVYKARFVL